MGFEGKKIGGWKERGKNLTLKKKKKKGKGKGKGASTKSHLKLSFVLGRN